METREDLRNMFKTLVNNVDISVLSSLINFEVFDEIHYSNVFKILIDISK